MQCPVLMLVPQVIEQSFSLPGFIMILKNVSSENYR